MFGRVPIVLLSRFRRHQGLKDVTKRTAARHSWYTSSVHRKPFTDKHGPHWSQRPLIEVFCIYSKYVYLIFSCMSILFLQLLCLSHIFMIRRIFIISGLAPPPQPLTQKLTSVHLGTGLHSCPEFRWWRHWWSTGKWKQNSGDPTFVDEYLSWVEERDQRLQTEYTIPAIRCSD